MLVEITLTSTIYVRPPIFCQVINLWWISYLILPTIFSCSADKAFDHHYWWNSCNYGGWHLKIIVALNNNSPNSFQDGISILHEHKLFKKKMLFQFDKRIVNGSVPPYWINVLINVPAQLSCECDSQILKFLLGRVTGTVSSAPKCIVSHCANVTIAKCAWNASPRNDSL